MAECEVMDVDWMEEFETVHEQNELPSDDGSILHMTRTAMRSQMIMQNFFRLRKPSAWNSHPHLMFDQTKTFIAGY